MNLYCVSSSSAGNCYLLTASDRSTLILECGVPISSIYLALGRDLGYSKVAGCLVSHQHRDHSRALPDLQRLGTDIYALEDVFASHKLRNRVFCTEVTPRQRFAVGDFSVLPLDVRHDVPCLAFVISHREMGNLLFVTDTMLMPYRVKGLNHILMEANYSDEILQENIDEGRVPPSHRDRLMCSHMELQTAIDALRATDLSAVNEIVLVHLSADNADPGAFKTAVEQATGKPTHIARNGLSLDVSTTPY
ncbi:MAG: MBL fold metallo-hydrolase [Bacteroidales bacterium]|nr:MBL fold metallo-hydrolase [Bacteroidales bacterium]